MSKVSVWRLFAFMDGDEAGEMDEHRRPAEWQLQDAVRWCVTRGYDHIYLSRDPVETARLKRAAPAAVRHHMHLIEGSRSEQPGDDAA